MAMNLTLGHANFKHLKETMPFKWTKIYMNYLGRSLTRDLSLLYSLNLPLLLRYIRTDLER